jgi:hypothetical protein
MSPDKEPVDWLGRRRMTPDEETLAHRLFADPKIHIDPPAKASTSFLVGHGLGAFAYGFVFGMGILGLCIMLGLIPA